MSKQSTYRISDISATTYEALADSDINITKGACEVIAKSLIATMRDMVIEGAVVVLPKLGKLEAVQRAPRKGRNPHTGEDIDIPAKMGLKFTASDTMKQAVNGDVPKAKAKGKGKTTKGKGKRTK